MKKLACFTSLVFLLAGSIYGQEVANRIEAQGTMNYGIWQKTVRDYVRELDQQGITDRSRLGLNQVHRMMWFHKNRLDAQGNVVNSDLYNAAAYKQFVRDNALMPFASVSPQTGEWYFGGPTNIRLKGTGEATGIGRVTFVKLDPNDAANASQATIYVGAPKGGIWKGIFNKSTGLVPSWTCLTDGLPDIGAVDLVIHPTNRNVMYLVSGDNNAGINVGPSGIGIMRTTDGGATWTPTAYYDDDPTSGFSSGNIRKLLMDNSNPNQMWIATTAGIIRTTDAWQTFANERTGNFWDLEKGRNSSNQNLIACTSSRVYTSGDFGNTWTAVRTNDNSAEYAFTSNRAELAVSADFGSNRSFYLWLAQGSNSVTTNLIKLYAGSTSTWTDQNATGLTVHVYRNYCMAFEVSQTNNAIMYCGGLQLQRSTNSGDNFSDFNAGVPGGGTYSGDVHADQHFLAWDQGFLFLGNDGGVYNYNNTNGGAGAGWRYLSDGMAITQYYRLSYNNNSNGFRWLAGAQDMGTHRNSATHVGCCDGMESLIDYNNPAIVYGSHQNGNVYRSTDAGDNWSDFMPANFGNNNVWITPMAMHKSNPAIIALAELDSTITGKIMIYNGSWSQKAGASAEFVWLAFAKSAPNVLYGITSTRIYRISDVTAASPTVTNFDLPVSNAASLAVDPDNSSHLFLTAGGYTAGAKVYESTDQGETWTNISLNLPNTPINCVIMNAGANNDVYVGTEIGVFVRVGSWGYWAPFMNGLPITRISDLEIDGGLLSCATYGRGRWYTNLYGSCVGDLDLTPSNDPSNNWTTGYQYYTAAYSISSTRIVSGGEGTNVTYRAGRAVRLAPGFHAQVNNEFRAMIAPCFPGGPAPMGGFYDSAVIKLEPMEGPRTTAKQNNYMKPAINW